VSRAGARGVRAGRLLAAAALALLAFVGAAPAEPAAGEVETALLRHILERAEFEPDAIELPSLDALEAARREHPGAELRLSSHPQQAMSGTVPITVALVENGEERAREVVTARVTVSGRVWVAARALPQGTVVHPADLEPVQRELSPQERERLLSRDEIVGRRTTRAVAAGAAWREGLVADSVLVERGDLVRLRLRSGALQVEALGRAREDGRPGEQIRVVNVDTRREVSGRVTPDGAVDVSF
jgi:flagella basal body P-ring formation protein FlgA